MENASYIGLSRQMAMRRQMDVIANNLANMNTASYRSEKVLFEEYLMKAPNDLGAKTSFVLDYGVLRSLAPGPIQPTGNPLDLAISGKGFFAVETPEGRRFTRNGNLRIDDNGQLTTPDGFALLDERNRPISVDIQGGQITIARDGTISNAEGQIGRINLVQFKNELKMQKFGNNLYTSEEQEQPAVGADIVQGAIEGSNVQPILEMTNMIELQRNYQAMQRMLDTDQELQRRSIERLARVA